MNLCDEISYSCCVDTPTQKRPWGGFKTLGENIASTVKVIFVDANQELSLQYHSQRLEHWIIVNGDGIVTIGEREYPAFIGKEFEIRQNIRHRIKAGNRGIILVEYCPGKNFEEEDIVRIDDKYGRV